MSLKEDIAEILIEEPQKKKIEKKKDVKYPVQRQEILKKVYEIIGVSPTKPYFKTHEIDLSEEIAQRLSELEPEIHRYFNDGSWAVFRSNNNVNKRSISIVRSILKDMNIKYTSSIEKLINNPNCKFTTIYTINDEIVM